jgi:two-component system OmpR family sensor kinase
VSWPIAAAVLLLLGVGAIAHRELRAYLFEQCAVRLRAQAKPLIDRRLEHLSGQVDIPELAQILAMDLTTRETTALVVDRSGTVLASGPPQEGPEPPLLEPDRYRAAFEGDPHVTYSFERAGARLLVVLIPPRAWLPDPPAVVQLTTSLGREERLLARLALALGGSTLALGWLTLIVAELGGGPLTLAPLLSLPVVAVLGRLARARNRLEITELEAAVDAVPATGARADFTATMRRVEAAFLAQAASEERMRRFIADASHELRTPLTSLGGAADVLLGGARNDPEHVERLARVIRSQADRMQRLVEDLLTLARLDSGENPLERGIVRLDHLLLEHAEELALAAPDRKVEVDARLAVSVQGDDGRLRQVLSNLTSNAVRHTRPGGHIWLSLERDGDDALVAVSDDGEGIPEDDLPRVFERFFRGDPARSLGGAGLGLAIARGIVEAHGGSISAGASAAGGARFEVRLPCTAPDLTRAAAER